LFLVHQGQQETRQGEQGRSLLLFYNLQRVEEVKADSIQEMQELEGQGKWPLLFCNLVMVLERRMEREVKADSIQEMQQLEEQGKWLLLFCNLVMVQEDQKSKNEDLYKISEGRRVLSLFVFDTFFFHRNEKIFPNFLGGKNQVFI